MVLITFIILSSPSTKGILKPLGTFALAVLFQQELVYKLSQLRLRFWCQIWKLKKVAANFSVSAPAYHSVLNREAKDKRTFFEHDFHLILPF